MRFPVAIEIGDENTAYGVVVPDLPGCFSAGDTLDDAMVAAKEAVLAWMEVTLDAGGMIPEPSTAAAVRLNHEYAGWVVRTLAITLPPPETANS